MLKGTEKRHDGTLVLYLDGRLDHHRSGPLWTRIAETLREDTPSSLVCDLREVSFVDTAGIALLLELQERCASSGIGLALRNLPESAQRMLERESGTAAFERQPAAPAGPGWISRLGGWFAGRLASAHSLVSFLGNFVAACCLLIRRPGQIRFRDFLFHFQQVGSEATLLICALNALTGTVVVFQGETVADTFGAPIYVADMVARSVTGQMSPVLTAILIAGRSGTSFAAKIGTMKVRQELDVLSVMNFNIVGFLVLPRVLAVSVATPLLTMLANASGILGGMLTSTAVLNLSPTAFLSEVQATLSPADIATGLIKGLVFGLIIGLTGCFHGLRTENTADSVGVRTTAAVVSSIFFIILVDTLFAALFNQFGW
jgi:phospholipid/cholesterol/gamma-HCH transport system permease protein